MKQETKNCQNCKQDFVIEPEDFNFYEKIKVPPPNVCPDCRFKMRALFRNETTLYSGRKCALCDKAIISMYNPKSPYTIYCYECFYSERWDPSDYAMDYDENRPFLLQLKELFLKVPKITTYISLGAGPNINSEYTNMVGGCKNCYLVFNTSPAENVSYSRGLRNVKDSSDLYFGQSDERCYECINVQESYGTIWGKNLVGCVDSAFLLNCRNLVSCFGCVNLNNKSYHFLNKQLKPEEYKKKAGTILGSYEKMEEFKKEFDKFSLDFPRRENNNIQTVNSDGDYLFECKNVKNSFEVYAGEDSQQIYSAKGITDSLGVIGYGTKSERLLECVATGLSSNVIGTYGAENSQDILYGFYVSSCKDCIGCDALRHKQYSILNKQYTKEEYKKLKEKIINELINQNLYGLMPPPDIAPFAYNETIAQDNFPMTKEEVLAMGFRWQDDIQKTENRETIKPENLPDHIKDVENSIINETLKCADCNRNYKIIEIELSFYRRMNLPISRKCFFCRHKDRIMRRGPYKFWNRECMKCRKSITTNYAPDRPEIVYCEKCYQAEVY